jgi:cytochrome c2
VAGKGGNVAVDLGKQVGRDHTPAGLAATLWNHAPTMWEAMEAKGISKPQLTPAQAADLFAFFHASAYFEKPGDAGRGKQVFESKGCAGCHSLAAGGQGAGPAVSEWTSLQSTIALAGEMWNHAPAMEAALKKSGRKRWPKLTPAEMTDLLIYLRHVPGQRDKPASFALSDVEGGRELLTSKGCAKCHSGASGYGGGGDSHTVTAFAATMWNHAGDVVTKQAAGERTNLTTQEAESIVAALWYDHLYAETGDARRGAKVYAQKGCAGCHDTATPLEKRAEPLRAFGIVSALWLHGPQMQEQMKSKGVAWPRLSVADMANLLAYLNRAE